MWPCLFCCVAKSMGPRTSTELACEPQKTAHAVTRMWAENKNKNACCQKPKESKSPAAKMMSNKTIKHLRPRGWENALQ